MFHAWHTLSRRARAALTGLALALAYFGTALAALELSYADGRVAPLWPPAGLAAVAVARWGWRVWPAVFAGALLSEAAANGGIWTAPFSATGKTLEPLLAVWLLRRLGVAENLARIADVLRFLVVVAVAPLVSSLLSPPALALAGVTGWHEIPRDIAVWWLGDAMGLLIVVPLFTTWLAPEPAGSPLTGNAEKAAVVVAVGVMATLAFGPLSEWVDARLGRAPLSFMVFPALLWAAIRWGPRGASLALALTAAVAVVRSTSGHGPFAGGPMPHNLIVLELFLASAAVTTLLLAAAVCACHWLIADLERARTEAQAAGQETARLMATVRHDLAHPLQAATLFLATMRHDPLPPTAQPLLDRTVASLKAMEEMLAGLTEVTSLDAGGGEIHRQTIALADILDQLAEEAAMHASATAGLDFRYVRSSATVRTDPVLLARMVRNLLANAVRYTPKGRVLLGCRIADGLVRIQVHDTGPGIPANIQATIFDAFRRGSTIAGGVGLGLSIVRRLAAHLGHEIGFVSEEGKGSCFWVAVPLAD